MKTQAEFDALKIELREVQKQISELRNKEYTLNSKYTELLKENCREHIGRCFKKMKGNKILKYCKIIGIDKPVKGVNGEMQFNQYQYPALWFSYPYNGDKMPFYEDNIFSGVWGEGNDIVSNLQGVTYEEITAEEFQERFNEVNTAWIKGI